MAAGVRLGARTFGLAAAGNHPWLAVHRRPRVGLLATGDEIALPGDPLGPGGIVSSNVHALSALVRAAGGEPVAMPIARDSAAAIAEAVEGAAGLDMLVTTGGASVGDYDLVQAGLAQQGFVLDFWRIAMRPGKPLLFGSLRGVPVLGLPGNPGLCIRVRHPVRVASGYAAVRPATCRRCRPTPMPLGCEVPANDHREDYLRALVAARAGRGLDHATPFPKQDSSMLQCAGPGPEGWWCVRPTRPHCAAGAIRARAEAGLRLGL